MSLLLCPLSVEGYYFPLFVDLGVLTQSLAEINKLDLYDSTYDSLVSVAVVDLSSAFYWF